MKNEVQQQKEREQQAAKARRELKASLSLEWGTTDKTYEQLVADLKRRRLAPVLTLADFREQNYREQSAQSGQDALKAFSENDDEKGRYFSRHAFNLALHALGRYDEYTDWLFLKYEKVHAFKSSSQGCEPVMA